MSLSVGNLSHQSLTGGGGCLTIFFFSTGLVRLYITGLPLRSYQTIGTPSVQGSVQCSFFRFWQQQDSNPHPGDYHADVLPLRHFEVG